MICLLVESFREMEIKLNDLKVEANEVGLKINSRKIKEMRINNRKNSGLTLDGVDIERVDAFFYLGSMVMGGSPGELSEEIVT